MYFLITPPSGHEPTNTRQKGLAPQVPACRLPPASGPCLRLPHLHNGVTVFQRRASLQMPRASLLAITDHSIVPVPSEIGELGLSHSMS